ncbi:MAG: mechanosensitive ion channel family protein [Thermoanaerobaculia bacterium]
MLLETGAGGTVIAMTDLNFSTWLPWLESRPLAATAAGALAVAVATILAYVVTRRYLLSFLQRLAEMSKSHWDDVILEHGVLRRAAKLAPLLVVFYGTAYIPHLPQAAVDLVSRITLAAIVFVVIFTLIALLDAAGVIFSTTKAAAGRSLKGYVQLVQIFVGVMGTVLVVAVLMNKSPWGLLTGIGAITAVLMLIFQDTILSVVASVQIASNDMVRIGDWIEVPESGADGDVIDIALHTVKVQNWDKTISTIPTHKLISDSFKNWRGMTDSGGRRIKRSIYIDMTTVRFLDKEDLKRFERFVLLEEYIKKKRQELEEYNRRVKGDRDLVANARLLTNLGTLRAYIVAYLKDHPVIEHEKMTFLVRQLQPGPQGIPLEIYVFSKDTRWVNYEGIQADIFDHILAIIPEFGLRVFQSPTGQDLARLISCVAKVGGEERKSMVSPS